MLALETPHRCQKFLNQLDVKFTNKHLMVIKEHLPSDISKLHIYNPFLTCPSGKASPNAISYIVMLLAKELQEALDKKNGLSNLVVFVSNHLHELQNVLNQKSSHSHMFCLTFIRVLQYYSKSKRFIEQTSKINFSPFIELFSAVFQNKKQKNISKAVKSDQKQMKQTHTIYWALLLSCVLKYVRQINQEQYSQSNYLEQSLQAACLMSQQTQNDCEKELARDYLTVTTHLLIFNGLKARPVKLLEFCFEDNQLMYMSEEHKQELKPQLTQNYFITLTKYSKTDNEYLKMLLKTIKNLINLNINNTILVSLFKIVLSLIELNLYSFLKIQVFNLLIESLSKRNILVVDQICQCILNSQIDLLDPDTQKFMIILAQNGDQKRKKKIALIYYSHYGRLSHKITAKTVNFIFKAYLQQQLTLENIQFLTAKEALLIIQSNINKLHQIISEKPLNTYLSLLQIILQQRILLIRQNQLTSWLQSARSSENIYIIYLKMISGHLLKKSLEIYPSLINLKSCVVKIEKGPFCHCMKLYQILLKMAQEYCVFGENVLRYLIMLQSIFGQNLPRSSYSYFSKNVSKIVNPQSTFLTFLEYLVTLLKNRSSVLLYLQAVLQFQMSLNAIFLQKKLYDIGFLVRLIQQSEFFRLSTYSVESLVIIYELSLFIKEQQFQKDCFKIIQSWSLIMSRYQCKSISYLFVFREIKKIYPFIKERQMKNPSDRIKMVWDLILSLIEYRQQDQASFLIRFPNRLICTWRGQDVLKKQISIKGFIIRNSNSEIHWRINIETTIKRYIINVNNDKIIVQTQSTQHSIAKQLGKQYTIRQLKKRFENIRFSLRAQNKSKKQCEINFIIAENQLPQFSLDGNIKEISIDCSNNVIAKQIIIQDGQDSIDLTRSTSHILILNQWQIKISSLSKYIKESFCTKFDYYHAYCCIGQMLRHFNHVNLPFVFDIFIRLSVKLIKSINKKNVLPLMQAMTSAFNTIQQTFAVLRGRNKELKPVIQIQNISHYPTQLYYLFTTALLPLQFWQNYSEGTRLKIVQILKSLQNQPSFRLIQNRKFEFFDECLEICRQYQQFFQICKSTLQNHQHSDTLRIKFKRFIYLARQTSIFQSYFKQYFEPMFNCLNLQNKKYQFQQKRCLFVLKDYQIFKCVFSLCSIQTKIVLLHYYSQRPIFNPKNTRTLTLLKDLAQMVDTHQRFHLIPWLITEVKQLVFRSIHASKATEQNKYDYRVNVMYLQLLIINKSSGNNEQNQDILLFILQMLKKLQYDFQQQSSKNQLQSFLHTHLFLDFIKYIINEKSAKSDKTNINTLQQIYQFSISLITRLDKNNFLEFMAKYRYYCSQNQNLIISLIKHNKFLNLPLSHFSIFLQYLFQILILIEHHEIASKPQILLSMKEYMLTIFNQLEKKVNISKPLLYSYPQVVGNKDGIQNMSRIIRRMKRVQTENKVMQMRGGIYLKIISIIVKLMRVTPNQDYSNLIEYFLLGPKKIVKRSQKGIFGFIDSIQNINFNKYKSPIEQQMLQVNEAHKIYFNKEDLPYSNKYQEVDLTNYVGNYFLASLAQFLQKSSQNIPFQLLQTYSDYFVRGCSNPRTAKQLINSNFSLHEFSSYQQLNRILVQYNKISEAPTEHSNINSSPTKSYHSRRSQKQSELSKSPEKSKRRKASDNSYEMQKANQVLQLIKQDCKNWYKKEYCNKISLWFCEKAKEIRIIEFIHTHFVLKGKMNETKISSSIIMSDQDLFMRQYSQIMNQQKKKLGQVNLQSKVRKVKKIYPYTSSQSPVYKIAQNCLANMTCPITIKITKQDYRIRRLKSQQSMNMNYYISSKTHQQSSQTILEHPLEQQEPQVQKINTLFSPITDYEPPNWSKEFASQKTIQNEQFSQLYCELVTRQGVYFCQYKIQGKLFKLQSKMARPEEEKLWYLKLGTPKQNILPAQIKLQIYPQEVSQIFYRKFNQITFNSIQIFMKNGVSKFISFYKVSLQANAMRKLQKLFKGIKIIKDPVAQFEQSNFMELWTSGLLSNFDYLMIINKYSGRSYNDLNQYYVFPWIIQDYTSNKIDLTDPNIYRDLSKPIGALNPQKLKRYQQKYMNEKNNSQRCMYGSHYSTSLFLFYYLVRVQPFSSLHRQMQKDNWDVADRLFNSLAQVWQSLMCQTSASDIKECIPQFYYMPAFLKNIANIELGQKQCGSDVSDVELPPWASNAQQFIVTMRAALESDYVSQNLHHWIDLIFGKYQNSQQKDNVFHPYCYSDPEVISKFTTKDLKNIDKVICQISYFGQCPLQLFKKQHKPKKTYLQLRREKSQRSSHQINLQASLPNYFKAINVQVEYPNFYVQIQNKRKAEKAMLSIPACTNLQGLKESIKDILPMRKLQSKKKQYTKATINENNQLYVGQDFIMDIDIEFNFQKSILNELWIACYGIKGLCVYNWQLELNWSWLFEEVAEVYLEPTRIIFCTHNGKLYFYSFFTRELREIIVFKESFSMGIKIMCLPKLPSNCKNQTQYKILCIGDEKNLSIINYTCKQQKNYSTLNLQSQTQ